MAEPRTLLTRRRDMRLPGALVVLALVLCGLAGCGDDGADTTRDAGRGTSPDQPTTTASDQVVGEQLGQVRIPGVERALLLTRETHPRGGFQIHLYAEAAAGDVELVDAEGNPVVPFVATDTRPADPVSADCTPRGFTVTSAEPTNPPGVMFAWDVYRTTYQLDGTKAVAQGRKKLRTSVPTPELRRASPGLFAHRMFATCRAG